MPLDQLNIRTEEIDEILGKTPNKIIRWGVTVLFLVIIALLTGSWFFIYPDFISSTIEITTLTPPADVVAKATGKIDSMYVHTNEQVNSDQVLAIIDNPGNYRNILHMQHLLDSLHYPLQNRDSLDVLQPFLPPEMQLGELQAGFSEFVSDYNNLAHYFQMGYFHQKIGAVKKQIRDYQIYYNFTYDQKRTIKADLLLAEKDYHRYEKLYANQSIPVAELEKAKSRYLNKKFSFENMRTSLANINIQISQLESNIIDLQLQDKQQKNKLLLSSEGAFNNLKARMDIWEKQYVLKAPVAGKCIFTNYWSKNQNVTAGKKVMTIIPVNSSNIVGKLLLPVVGAGKVKVGQKVNIRLFNYPYMEFGMLEGVVQNISSVPNENHYYVEVTFPKGMKTSYGIELSFSQNMQGSAEIITKNIRLLDRILRPVESIITEKVKR